MPSWTRSCASSPLANVGEARLFEDMGPHHREITTSSDEAQLYFDQGMNWMAAQMMAMEEGKKEEVMEEMMGEDEEMPDDLFRAALNYMF